MPDENNRPMPLIGDIALSVVQRIEHALDAGFVDTPVVGLDGEVQQRAGRRSHRIYLAGLLSGETAVDDLKALQELASGGEETPFSSDIVTALELEQVVVTGFRATQRAGEGGRYDYEIWLAESPPLPPPAQLQGFGGLDDFGLGDLGFDTPGLLDDIAGLAEDVAGAVDQALGAIDALSALASLDGLSLSGPLQPLEEAAANVESVGQGFRDALDALSSGFTS